MLLSDVVRQLSQRSPLPEKTVVLVFDPGFRRTADTYSLSVKAHEYSRRLAHERQSRSNSNDKRFISQHLAARHAGVRAYGISATTRRMRPSRSKHKIIKRCSWATARRGNPTPGASRSTAEFPSMHLTA